MPYLVPATSETPALIVYLLNVSQSMSKDADDRTRIEIANGVLERMLAKMVQRSTRGSVISPRYRIALFVYGSRVTDLLGGIKTISDLSKKGAPQLKALSEDVANTSAAFAEAERLLLAELSNIQNCPAPLVCHITDGKYSESDPIPIAKRILDLSVPDGNVLIENIYVKSGDSSSDSRRWLRVLAPLLGLNSGGGVSISNIRDWGGISSERKLSDEYSRSLFRISSPIPKSYLSLMREFGYHLDDRARMLFPGDPPDLAELAFPISGVSSNTAKRKTPPKRLDPRPDDLVKIGDKSYRFAPHPAAPSMVFGQEGRKSIVYQLKPLSGDNIYALKVFKQVFREPYIRDVAQRIAIFADLPGMVACRRMVLNRNDHNQLIEQYPELEYAVLMPWVGDTAWQGIILSDRLLSRDQSLSLAKYTAFVLATLESRGLAHCDIAGSNVLVYTDQLAIHLVDLEDIYGPELLAPSAFPAGTLGYQHPTIRKNPRGQWCAEGDRFSGAIMLAEMLGWHDSRILSAADDEHYFEQDEIQEKADSDRYRLMLDVLASFSKDVAELFEKAWHSATLGDCPELGMWFDAIANAEAGYNYLSIFSSLEREVPLLRGWEGIKPSQVADPFGDLAPQPLDRKKH
jgi:hypothetical protein